MSTNLSSQTLGRNRLATVGNSAPAPSVMPSEPLMESNSHEDRIGGLPTTYKTVKTIERVQHSPIFTEIHQQSSPAGKKLLSDASVSLDKFKTILTEKNAGDHFQKMIASSMQASKHTDLDKLKRSGSSADFRKSLSFTGSSIVAVIQKIVTSSEFRNGMKQLVNILLEIFRLNFGDVSPTAAVDKVVDSLGSTIENSSSSNNDTTNGNNSTTESNVPTESLQQERTRSTGVPRELAPTTSNDNNNDSMIPRSVRDGTYKGKTGIIEVPEDMRTELVEKLKSVVQSFSGREDYQKALDDLLDSMENLARTSTSYASTVKSKGKESVSEADTEWRNALDEARQFLDNLSSSSSFTSILTAIRTFLNDIMSDQDVFPQVRRWWDLIRSVLKNPQYTENHEFKNELQELTENTKGLFTGTHRDNASQVYNTATDYLRGIRDDPTNKDLADSLSTIWADMFLDADGNVVLKKDLLVDLSHAMEILSKKIESITLPPIQRSDDKMDLSISNLQLQCTGLIPKDFHVAFSSNIDIQNLRLDSQIHVSVSQIQIQAHNAHFSLAKKGFSRWRETGDADFAVRGSGLSASLTFAPYVSMDERGMSLTECKVHMGKLRLVLSNTQKHPVWFYSLARWIVQPILKRAICASIEDNIRKLVDPHYDSGNGGDSGTTTVTPAPGPSPTTDVTNSSTTTTDSATAPFKSYFKTMREKMSHIKDSVNVTKSGPSNSTTTTETATGTIQRVSSNNVGSSSSA